MSAIYEFGVLVVILYIFRNTLQTTFELRLSSREQKPEVEASCKVFIHLLYFLARSLDFRLLFAGTEAQFENGLLVLPFTNNR